MIFFTSHTSAVKECKVKSKNCSTFQDCKNEIGMRGTAGHNELENFLFTVAGALSVILNLAEIILIAKKWRSLKSYDQLLLSLSASDFITGLTFFGFGISHFSGLRLEENETRGVSSIGLIMAFAISVKNLLLIGLDRLVAVRFPIKHRIWMTRNKMNFIIVMLWTVMIFCEITMLLFWRNQPMRLENGFHQAAPWAILSSAVIFTMMYAQIIYIVVKKKHLTNPQSRESRRHDNVVITTCISIVLIYLACSCPIAFQIAVEQKSNYKTTILLVINSVLDPLVYFYKSHYEERIKKNIQVHLNLAMKMMTKQTKITTDNSGNSDYLFE